MYPYCCCIEDLGIRFSALFAALQADQANPSSFQKPYKGFMRWCFSQGKFILIRSTAITLPGASHCTCVGGNLSMLLTSAFFHFFLSFIINSRQLLAIMIPPATKGTNRNFHPQLPNQPSSTQLTPSPSTSLIVPRTEQLTIENSINKAVGRWGNLFFFRRENTSRDYI